MATSILLSLVTLVIFSIAIGVVVLVLSLQKQSTLVFLLVWFVSIFAGLVEYYVGNKQILWLSFGFGFGIGIISFLKMASKIDFPISKFPTNYYWFFSFTMTVFFSSLLNFNDISSLVVGIKIYIVMHIGVFTFIAVRRLDTLTGYLNSFFNWLPFIQLPFVIHQHFVIAAARTITSYDAVVGTFGGAMNGGGASPSLMLASVISVLLSTHQFIHNKISTFFFGSIILVSIANIALGEVKAVFVILPTMLFLAFHPTLLRRPGLLIAVTVVVALLSLGMMQIYEQMYWTQNDIYYQQDGSRLDQFLGYFFDANYVNYATGEVSRGASLALWWNRGPDGLASLFGNGAGSTRGDSTVANGVTSAMFNGIEVGTTLVAQLLWDVGIVGTCLYLVFLVSLILDIYRCSRRETDPFMRSELMVICSIATYPLLTIIYNRYFVDRPTEQMLIAFLMAVSALAAHKQRGTVPTGNTVAERGGLRAVARQSGCLTSGTARHEARGLDTAAVRFSCDRPPSL